MNNDQLPDMSHLPAQDQQAIQDFAAFLREKAAAKPKSKLHIGMRARVISPDFESCGKTGTIYNYLPSRPWPYHWLPDGEEPGTGAGIAFLAEELEPIEEGKQETAMAMPTVLSVATGEKAR